MTDRALEDMQNRTRRFEVDSIISLVVGLICCSPVGLFLGIRTMNGAAGLLAEIQSGQFGEDLENRIAFARTMATVAVAVSGIFLAIIAMRVIVFFAMQ